MFDYSQKVVIITGGKGFLGSYLVQKYSELGAIVNVIDNQVNSEDIETNEGNIYYYKCDLNKETNVENTINEIESKFNKIDILVNIAGGFTMSPKTHEIKLDDLYQMLDMNFLSMFNSTKFSLPSMLKHQSGKIVNIGARAALSGANNMGPYVVSKSMVLNYTQTIAKEYIDSNINVNCVLPGTIDTPRNRNDMPNANHDSWVPIEDISNLILFLTSDLSSSISGALIPIYGKTL